MVAVTQGKTYTGVYRNYHYTVPCWEWTKQVTIHSTKDHNDEDNDDYDSTDPYGIPLVFSSAFRKAASQKPAEVYAKGKEFSLMLSPSERVEFTVIGYNSFEEVAVEVKRSCVKSGAEKERFTCLITKQNLGKVLEV